MCPCASRFREAEDNHCAGSVVNLDQLAIQFDAGFDAFRENLARALLCLPFDGFQVGEILPFFVADEAALISDVEIVAGHFLSPSKKGNPGNGGLLPGFVRNRTKEHHPNRQ
jgi:hypothetical protein